MKKVGVVLSVLLVTGGTWLFASGTSAGGFSATGGINQKLYNEGKAIFNRKVSLTAQVSEEEKLTQQQKLTELEARLPVEARSKGNITELAGKLTPEQLAALEHFLRVRYNLK